MLCSKCSAEVKPIVALDIDGTLGDYHTHFLMFASRYLGKTDGWWTDMYGGGDHGSFREWFCKASGQDLRTFRDIKLAYRQGAQKRSMPIFRGASALTELLKDGYGAEVWITTTRPFLRLDNVDPDTRFWLEHHGIKYDNLIADDEKMGRLWELVDPYRVVGVLDDLLPPLIDAVKLFPNAITIMRKTAYNMKLNWVNEADELKDAGGWISEKIKEWEVQYA